jgi:hypothetical protein
VRVARIELDGARVGLAGVVAPVRPFVSFIALPQANAEGMQEFNFVDRTTVWWLTRAGVLPFRFVTRRGFLTRQIEIVRSRSTPSTGLLAYSQRLLGDATDDVAFVKQAQVPGLTESGYVFTTPGGQSEPDLCHGES